MADLLADLAAGLTAFFTDLANRMGRITVVTMSEFGRRVRPNGSGGTDLSPVSGASSLIASRGKGPADAGLRRDRLWPLKRGKRSYEFELEDRADPLHIAGIPRDEDDTGFAATESDEHVEDEAPWHAREIKGALRSKLRERQAERVPGSA